MRYENFKMISYCKDCKTSCCQIGPGPHEVIDREDFLDNYETTDNYVESIHVELTEKFSFSEIPKNIHAEYNGCTYDLKFEKINDQKLKIHRVYNVNRVNVQPEDFAAFKVFMTKVNEAENTYLLFE